MPAVTVRIPQPLRAFTHGRASVAARGATVREVLDDLAVGRPGLAERLWTPHGELRPLVKVFLGSTELRELDGLDTRVSEGDVVSIVPAVAGGMRRHGA